MANTKLGMAASRLSKSRGFSKQKPRSTSLSGSTKKKGCGCKK